MGPTAYGDAVTDTSATPLYPLMSLREEDDATYGHQVYRYVRIDAGGLASAGRGVMKKDGAVLGQAIVSGANATKSRMLGVSLGAVTASYYCWVLADGTYPIVSGGAGTTANTVQKTVAAGAFDDGAYGVDDAAWAQAAALAGATFLARIEML